jgi:hypothetical protein
LGHEKTAYIRRAAGKTTEKRKYPGDARRLRIGAVLTIPTPGP